MEKAALPVFQRALATLVRRIKQLEELQAESVGGGHVSLKYRPKLRPQYVMHLVRSVALLRMDVQRSFLRE
jgi:hypothetical protein